MRHFFAVTGSKTLGSAFVSSRRALLRMKNAPSGDALLDVLIGFSPLAARCAIAHGVGLIRRVPARVAAVVL